MQVLIIEDDENKRSQLKDFITTNLAQSAISIAKSYHSGLREIINLYPDFIILDMTMPTYDVDINEDGGRPQHYAGREILRQMDRRAINIPTVVITGFDHFGEGENFMSREQLDKELKLDHEAFYKGTVYFNTATDDWKLSLLKIIKAIFGD
jgi:DNA-binding NarL/FixJ family response regulator